MAVVVTLAESCSRAAWRLTPAVKASGRVGPAPVVVVIALVALLLRLQPFSESLFGDEMSTFYIVTGHSLRQVGHILYGHSVDLNPPFYFALAWLSEQVLGGSAQALRLISLLAGVATVPLTYVLAARTGAGRTVGYLAAALVALSPFLIEYSTEARPYALLVVLVLAVLLTARRALDGGSRRWWLAYAVLMAAAMYTHYTSVFPLVAIWLWGVLSRPAVRLRLVIAAVAAVILFAPWIPALVADSRSSGTHAIEQLEPFGLHAVQSDVVRASVGNPYVGLPVVPGEAALWLTTGALVLAVLTLPRRRLGTARQAATPVAILMLATPVGLAVWSTAASSVWDLRNLTTALPGLAAAVALLVVAGRRGWRWVWAAVLLVAMAGAAAHRLRTDAQRPNYDAAARYIARAAPNGAPVVDFGFYTPGPPTETEAALALGPLSGRDHPILRVGLPPLAAVLKAPPYAPLPSPAGEAIGRQAVRLAHAGQIFLVTPGRLPPPSDGTLRLPPRTVANPQEYDFLNWIRPRVRVTQVRGFAGLAAVTVYRLSLR